ncbi:MAG TPA: MFS transporter [Vicinamibacterales bacterium]|jgi:MFS family permease|nr:MFS transporter [Vicinamibacterales bacterium]
MTLPSSRVRSGHAEPEVAQAAAARPFSLAAPPTRARHTVTIFAVTLAVITYIDRVCISQAAPAIRTDLGLTAIQMGWAFTAFTWAYALFEIPGGWLGDRIGPRLVLMRVVVWWSFFTAATGWVWNLASLLVTRTLFGIGEAGCFPNLTRAFTTWLPRRERERAQAILWLGARWGGAFTPLLVASILHYISWRRAFEIFGIVGIIWAWVFFRWFRDDPSTHPSVNAAELALMPPRHETAAVHGAIPWQRFFASRAVWLLWAQYVCLCYGWYFYITWLPTYLRDARGVGLMQGAVLAGLPLFFGGIGCLVSGWTAPRLATRIGSVTRARRLLAVTGFLGGSASILVFTRLQDPTLAMIALGLSSFFNDFVMPPAWAACMDIGGRYSGTLSGSMNMVGNFAGGFSPLVVGYLLAWTAQNWTLTFYISAAIYSLGAICWLFLDSHEPLEA